MPSEVFVRLLWAAAIIVAGLALYRRVVLPDELVGAIVEVEIFQPLELRAHRREQLLADAHVIVHGAAGVEEQQHLDRVVPLRHQLEVEPAGIVRGRADGVG